MAYGANPSGNNRDAVRLLVGDISTSTAGEFLANGDYDFFIAQTPSIYAAAALAANSLAMAFGGAAVSSVSGGYVTKEVGDLKLTKSDASQFAAQYRTLARRLDLMGALKIAPSAGGLQKPDGSTISPFFWRKQFDNASVGGTVPSST